MVTEFDNILAKKEGVRIIPLTQHLKDVADIAVTISKHIGYDTEIARKAALLHDIGKVSPIFQETLKKDYNRPPLFVWRHEIASLFFLQFFPESEWGKLTDMIVAHHKSPLNDDREKGIIDLEDNSIDNFELHAQGIESWSKDSINILRELGLHITSEFSLARARECYDFAIDHCEGKNLGYSLSKGILMAADHMASAMEEYGETEQRMFISPDLSFYNRESKLYPLSQMSANDKRPHTIVTAPTGAGKTDFLMRRCRGRVFYILPYQASINAMYDRFIRDLSDTDINITLLHAASRLKVEKGNVQEYMMQHMVGSSIKVMTPHQIASLIFGIKGFESLVVDMKGCDVILDEIHTYSCEIQAIVLRIIEVLVNIGCRVHVGTATMPSVLYGKVLNLLGGSRSVYEVLMPDSILSTFDRHIIHKVSSLDDCMTVIDDAVRRNNKVIIVCNQVKRSQQVYDMIESRYPDTKKMLLHSRYKRCDRAGLETRLTEDLNKQKECCIVVSTQVVEVSLDIDFDVMVTDCAPIDSMIQRFGRINRRRQFTDGRIYKHIYVISPPDTQKDALPYHPEILQESYQVLPDGDILHETAVQSMIDDVYPDATFMNIDYSGVCFADGEWMIRELCHHEKAAFFDLLNINSAVAVLESDVECYLSSDRNTAIGLEIPINIYKVRNLKQIDGKNNPFVIPDEAYDNIRGLIN